MPNVNVRVTAEEAAAARAQAEREEQRAGVPVSMGGACHRLRRRLRLAAHRGIGDVLRLVIELGRRDRDREPGTPRCWSMLSLMSGPERELFEPPPRPAPVEGFTDPLEIPPRWD